MVYFAAFEGVLSLHELLVSVFLFLTAPITAHFLAKAHMLRRIDPAKALPPAGVRGWSTFDAAADEGGERGKGHD
jgi:multicomponent K+:H+ antiporter subunit G